MRALVTLASVVTLLVAQPIAALAAPATRTVDPPTVGLVDRDGNRISDGLQASLADARSGDRFDVVVNTTTANSAAFARGQVGNFPVHREFRIIDGFHATMTKGQIQGLARSPKVKRIEENFTVHAMLDASQRDFGTADARADYGVDGDGVGVCVVDTGADANHVSLDGGKIVDWVDYVNNQPNPYDDHGHGTHVASTAVGDSGASGSTAERFQGVASDANAYIAKVLNSGGSGSDADIIAAIEWCAAKPGVHVISMSLGTFGGSDGQDGLSQAVNSAAQDDGKVVVVAAGNSGDDNYTVGSPGAAEFALTVGSVSKYSAPDGYFTPGIYLSEFSSRGPTLKSPGNPERIKPDVVAPGERTVAAKAGTSATYVEMTGTSMATPFVAGTVALALDANPSLSQAQIKSLVMSTAQDRGATGVDVEYGAGLLDGHAVVAEAAGAGPAPWTFPTHEFANGSVTEGGEWTYDFTLTDADLGVPIAATILIDGELQCVSGYGRWCFQYAYTPDLDAELLDPNGSLIDESTCPLGCGSFSVGHQETLAVTPQVAGTYAIRVYPFEGSGNFTLDLSRGPVGTGSPPSNTAPVANADAYATEEATTLTVGAPGVLANDTDADGDPLTASLSTSPANGALSLSADGSFEYTPNAGFVGEDSFTYVANDGTADSNTATVTIDVTAAPVNNAPVAADDAYTTGEGTTLTVAAPGVLGNDSDADGDPLTASMITGVGSGLLILDANGGFEYTPNAGFVGEDSFTYVADDGTADSNTATVTLTVAAAATSVHIGDLDVATSSVKNTWTALVTISVHDGEAPAPAGITVSYAWSDGTSGSCDTDSNGRCTASTTLHKKNGEIALTVTGVASPDYVPGDNHDPDGDSDGTTIIATKS